VERSSASAQQALVIVELVSPPRSPRRRGPRVGRPEAWCSWTANPPTRAPGSV